MFHVRYFGRFNFDSLQLSCNTLLSTILIKEAEYIFGYTYLTETSNEINTLQIDVGFCS